MNVCKHKAVIIKKNMLLLLEQSERKQFPWVSFHHYTQHGQRNVFSIQDRERLQKLRLKADNANKLGRKHQNIRKSGDM